MSTEIKTMKIVQTIEELTVLLERSKRDGKQVGFVPTMGFLHEGHLSLIETAKAENDIVVMSIFVNPAQFGPGEDFESYPRDTENDYHLATGAGVDILFIPSVEEMYPQDGGISILPGPLATVLCGASRPHHFDGVLKVVLKLVNLVDPVNSYFGMKDAQQLAIIETFVRDFNLRTTVVRVPTVRESDGLAKSSRNVNLTAQQRIEAPVLRQALLIGEKLLQEGVSPKQVEIEVSGFIKQNSTGSIDYVQVLAYPSLTTSFTSENEIILACAVKFGNVRLIDNIIM